MESSLQLRLALRQANGAFRAFPVAMSLPLVVATLLSTSGLALYYRRASPRPPAFSFWVGGLVVLYLLYWINCLGELSTSRLYLKAKARGRLGFGDLWQVFRYRGLANVVSDLLGRYIGWGIICGCALLVMVGLTGFIVPKTDFESITAALAKHQGWVNAIEAMLILPGIFYRYEFVLPQFAIGQGAGAEFVHACAVQAKTVWKIAVLVAVGDSLLRVFSSASSSHLPSWTGVLIVTNLFGSVIFGCFGAWMVLLRTALAEQLGPVSVRAPLPDHLSSDERSSA
jgi:hypothetical protein